MLVLYYSMQQSKLNVDIMDVKPFVHFERVEEDTVPLNLNHSHYLLNSILQNILKWLICSDNLIKFFQFEYRYP